MRFVVLLIILSVCCGFSGCQKPDAYLCTFVVKNPVDQSYSFCVNTKTKEEKSVPIKDMKYWITADPDSYEIFRDWYKTQCGGKGV